MVSGIDFLFEYECMKCSNLAAKLHTLGSWFDKWFSSEGCELLPVEPLCSQGVRTSAADHSPKKLLSVYLTWEGEYDISLAVFSTPLQICMLLSESEH